FFQAEDGIRDGHVTGVQTCALPIFVTAKDLLTLEKPWDEGEVLRITAKFLDHGCFLDGSTQMAVFQHLWGQVMSRSAGKRALPENTESRCDNRRSPK